MSQNTDQRRLVCYAVVRTLVQHYGWQLLDESAFVEAVFPQVAAAPTVTRDRVRKWCINAYCRLALYPACQGQHGPARQQQAFAELANYLYRLAHNRWPQVADDATQEALLLVHRKVDQCRNPGAFLAFAIQQLRDAARKYLQIESKTDSLDALLEQDFYGDTPASQGIAITVEMDTEEHAIHGEMKQQVANRIREVKQAHPRAARQLNAVWLRYIRDLNNEEIATLLETTPENVSVLLNRGLNRLRQDDKLRHLAQEILTLDRHMPNARG